MSLGIQRTDYTAQQPGFGAAKLDKKWLRENIKFNLEENSPDLSSITRNSSPIKGVGKNLDITEREFGITHAQNSFLLSDVLKMISDKFR